MVYVRTALLKGGPDLKGTPKVDPTEIKSEYKI